MKVLLAEDDPNARARFARVAEAAGHAVVAVADVDAAWDAYRRERPELVVVDLDLPDDGALTLCRRIRADEGAPAFVLVVTPREGSVELSAALDAGADDFLRQPAADEHLAARLTIAERRIALEAARRSAEAGLSRARYFAGIGETTVALQHEINNPLAALLGHAALLEQGFVEPDEEREVLGVIVEQAHRIAGVVRRLSALRDSPSVEYVEGAWMLDLSRAADAPTAAQPAPLSSRS